MTIKDEMIKQINDNCEYYRIPNLENTSKCDLIELYKIHVGDFEKFALNYICNIQLEIIKMMGLSKRN